MVIDGLRSLELDLTTASATGYEALTSELQDLAGSSKVTGHSMWGRTKEPILRREMCFRCSWIGKLVHEKRLEGVPVRLGISSSDSTVAMEQEYQAFEGARVLNASTWHKADHELMRLKQLLDMIWNDMDESFRDQVTAFNFVGIPERVEELEASSVLNREARLSIMLGCVVVSVTKPSFADSELAGASTVSQNIVQLRKAIADVGPTLRRRELLDLEVATQKLECRVVGACQQALERVGTRVEFPQLRRYRV